MLHPTPAHSDCTRRSGPAVDPFRRQEHHSDHVCSGEGKTARISGVGSWQGAQIIAIERQNVEGIELHLVVVLAGVHLVKPQDGTVADVIHLNRRL